MLHKHKIQVLSRADEAGNMGLSHVIVAMTAVMFTRGIFVTMQSGPLLSNHLKVFLYLIPHIIFVLPGCGPHDVTDPPTHQEMRKPVLVWEREARSG